MKSASVYEQYVWECPECLNREIMGTIASSHARGERATCPACQAISWVEYPEFITPLLLED